MFNGCTGGGQKSTLCTLSSRGNDDNFSTSPNGEASSNFLPPCRRTPHHYMFVLNHSILGLAIFFSKYDCLNTLNGFFLKKKKKKYLFTSVACEVSNGK